MAGQGRPLLAETKNKILRLELRGMSRTDIASACGVSKATVTRILGPKLNHKRHEFRKGPKLKPGEAYKAIGRDLAHGAGLKHGIEEDGER